jgi:heavy metal sensor kinase
MKMKLLRTLNIRLRLTLWYTVVLAAILCASSITTYYIMRNRLESLALSKLDSSYATIEAILKNSGGDLFDIYNLGQNNLFQLAHEGKIVYQTTAWQDEPWTGMLDYDSFGTYGIWVSVDRPVYWLKKGIETEYGYEIIIAQDTTSTTQSIKSLALVLIVGIPCALILAVLGGYFLAGRVLLPIKAITRKAREISADRLSERLPVSNPDDEIGDLASVFNETLSRLEGSFLRLRQFTSDASHELRTPLTSIRSVGEVALQSTGETKACQEAIGSMLEETERLTHLVDSLLLLARGDAGKAKLNPVSFDLNDLAGEVVDELSVLSEEKNQTLTTSFQPSIFMNCDKPTLRHAISNVLHNAIRYTPKGGHISVQTIKTEENKAFIHIIDDGPGIPVSERKKVFERFYRIGGGRSRTEGGIGLGLAIARLAVEANGGDIQFLEKDGPGTFCRISLPAE